jgi:SAM-dependent methyltransferase
MMDPQAFYETDDLNTAIYDARTALHLAEGAVDGDVEFYRELASETTGPVLDVGCGTGRVTFELARDGHEVVGVDLSAPMLAQAERRRTALPREAAARLSFVEADMTTLDLGRRFGLIVTPFRVFQFLLTPEAQRQALLAFRHHLAADGRLILDLFDPMLDRVVPTDEPINPRRAEVRHPVTGNAVTFEVAARNLEPEQQLLHEIWMTRELTPDGRILREESDMLTLRWSLRSELRHLFELTGFEVIGDYGDFHRGPPAYGREQVWVLRRSRTLRDAD